jgi:hypothetical protein
VGWESRQLYYSARGASASRTRTLRWVPQWDGSPTSYYSARETSASRTRTLRWVPQWDGSHANYIIPPGEHQLLELELCGGFHSGMGVPPAIIPPGEHQLLELIAESLPSKEDLKFVKHADSCQSYIHIN